MLNLSKKMIALCSAIIFFVALDRFLKTLILANQALKLNLFNHWLWFEFKANQNIAFSLPLSGNYLSIFIVLIIIGLILAGLRYYFKSMPAASASVFLVVFGAASNLYDRIKFGYVVDYLSLDFFSIFNLADAMIVAGTISLILFLYKKEPLSGS